MPFRFNRRVTIVPGLRINLGKRGVSLTEGVPGARVTVGTRGVRTSLGLPGTGIGWTETMERGRRAPHGAQGTPQAAPQARPGWQIALIIIGLLALLAIIASGGSH